MKLDRFKNAYYGGLYGCSCCGKPLNGYRVSVGLETDEEGYNWRSFCSECEKIIDNMTDEEIYSKYPVAPEIE